MNFAKFLTPPFLKNTSGRLLLKILQKKFIFSNIAGVVILVILVILHRRCIFSRVTNFSVLRKKKIIILDP